MKKKFGTMIIKPDAINVKDLSLIRDILIKYNLYEDNLCFVFDNYPETILEYRKKDILFKNITNVTSDLPDGMVRQSPDIELKNCKVALSAYEKFYNGKSAIVLLIPTHNKNYDEFFESMYRAKREIRNELKKHRDYCYAYVDYGTEKQEMKRLSVDEYNLRYENNPKSVNLAHVDGIHLEDKECFLDNFCFSFMVSTGIINRLNQISLSQQINTLREKEYLDD